MFGVRRPRRLCLSERCITSSDLRSGRKQQRNLRCGGRWSALVLEWRTLHVTHAQSLFEKPKPANPQQIVQPGFASFSPDGRWLFIIPPTLVSAADGESAVQGAPPQGAPPAPASAGHEPCKIQIWRWSTQNRTYEPTGEDLEIQRLRGSRFNFAWSNESDRLVIINARGTNEAECAFFEVAGTLPRTRR